MSTIRSLGRNASRASALSSVVLPVPVPPEMSMFVPGCTASRQRRCAEPRRQRADRDQVLPACSGA